MLEELRKREPIFHRPEYRITRAAFEAQTAPDFWEVGASGQRYDREAVWSGLAARYADPDYFSRDRWDTSEFGCRPVGEATYLLTYVLRQGSRVTRRLTTWECVEGGWRALYHQGTLAEAP